MKSHKMLTLPDGRTLALYTVLYVSMQRNYAEFHLAGGRIVTARMTMAKLEEEMGSGFVKIHRSILVSVRAIHDVTDTVNLSNGEKLNYVKQKKAELTAVVHSRRRELLRSLLDEDCPLTEENYREHYRLFDTLPIAFADIEMILDEQSNAVDWIFRYGNPALAALEKLPLEKLVGASFGSLFVNMDEKWIGSYERSALYGETLEIIDYSPEIDTYLKIISFPTFPGHCGCILFDISKLRFAHSCTDAERAMLMYLSKMAEL